MPVCKVCHGEFKSLDAHIRLKHKLSVTEYLEQYPGSVITDEYLVIKRTESRDAIKAGAKTKLTFERKYKGGHPMKDPNFVQNYRILRALDPHYNHEAAKATSIKKYGVEFYSQTEAAREVSRKNMKVLIDKGLTNAGKNKIDCPNEEDFVKAYNEGIPMGVLASTHGVSYPTIQRWVGQLGLPERTFVKTSKKDIKPPTETVRAYLAICAEKNTELSFHNYGVQIKSESTVTKLKRLFNKGGKLESLKSELSEAYKSPESIEEFLAKVKQLVSKVK